MSDTKVEAVRQSHDLERPEPKPAAEREVAVARYGLRGFKEMEGRDGMAYSLTLLRDGKPVARVRNDGNGGETWWENPKGRLLRQNEESEVEADAVTWFVGSDEEKTWTHLDGRLPRGCRDILVEELIRREDERKWFMKETRGGKRVLFQIGDDVGTQSWRQFPLKTPSHIADAVAQAQKKAGDKPVRIVYREGASLKTLKVETLNQ